jgi:hypothetical protein
MRVTTNGRICSAVHSEHREGTKKDGSSWESPESFTLLLCADFNAPLVRCKLTGGQYLELKDPSNFGQLVEVRGDTERIGFVDYLVVSSFQVSAAA